MKQTLKGIVLASLISTQLLAMPLSALATDTEETPNNTTPTEENVGTPAETTENATPAEAAPVEEAKPNEEAPKPAEAPAENSTPDEAKPSEEANKEETKPSDKEATKAAEDPAIEAKKGELRSLVAAANAKLDAGTFEAETSIPLRKAIEQANVLLDDPSATLTGLEAMIADVTTKMNALVSATPELSFLGNLIAAIEDGKMLLTNDGDLQNKFTPASIEARRGMIQTAIQNGEAVLASIAMTPDGEYDVFDALTKQTTISAAADQIIAAMNSGEGLISTGLMIDMINEINGLIANNVWGLSSRIDAIQAAYYKLIDLVKYATTWAEVEAALQEARTALDNATLFLTVNLVDENGNVLSSFDMQGLYKTAWTVSIPALDGYEFVSADGPLTGTYGAAPTVLTLTYKQVAENPVPPLQPASPLKPYKPINHTIMTTADPLKQPMLPKTGETHSSFLTTIGTLTAAAGAGLIAYFRRKKA